MMYFDKVINADIHLLAINVAAKWQWPHNNTMQARFSLPDIFRAAVVAAALLTGPVQGHANPGDPPYQEKIERLSEILGSIHYLRNLCGEKGTLWREKMDALLTAENPSAERRARMIASFNRGYRSFASAYDKCTSGATTALSRYSTEGTALTNEIVLRYGN